jgi:hypothetical protein
MSNSVLGLSIDCAELARFWAGVLDRKVSPQPTAAIAASEPTQGPALAFHQVPEAKTVKNRLLSLGATTGDENRAAGEFPLRQGCLSAISENSALAILPE